MLSAGKADGLPCELECGLGVDEWSCEVRFPEVEVLAEVAYSLHCQMGWLMKMWYLKQSVAHCECGASAC